MSADVVESPPGALRIAGAEECHIRAVAALERLCFSDPWREDDFLSLLGSPNAYFRVALVGDSVAGYIILIHAADTADLANIAVAPEMRRRGIGAALLDDALAFCRTHGIAHATLEVRESNAAARALYESRGFTAAGRRRGYYRHPREDAIIMARAL